MYNNDLKQLQEELSGYSNGNDITLTKNKYKSLKNNKALNDQFVELLNDLEHYFLAFNDDTNNELTDEEFNEFIDDEDEEENLKAPEFAEIKYNESLEKMINFIRNIPS